MNIRFLCLLYCFCFVLTNTGTAQDEIDNSLVEHLLTKGVENWQVEESKFDAIQVSFVVTYSDGPPSNPKHEFSQKWLVANHRKRGLTLARVQNSAVPDSISHDVSNAQYRFSVFCKNVDKQGTLQDLRVTRDKNKRMAVNNDPGKWNMNWKVLRARTYLLHIPLEEIVSHSSFQPVRVRLLKEPPGRIEFTAKYVGPKGKFRLPGGIYTIIINPEQRDRLEYWEVIFPNTENRTQSFEISYRPDDVQLPHEVLYRTRSGKFKSRQKWIIDRPEPFSIAEEEFHLPHYGFSEQVLDTLSPNPWPRWLLIIGGVLSITIGIWFIRRHERTQPDR